MFNIRKIIIPIVLIALFISFVFAVGQDSLLPNQLDTVEKIEMSEYYGIPSLLINLHLEIGRGAEKEEGIFDTVNLLNEMKYYSSLDIIDYLSSSFDVKETLEYLLFDISSLLDEASSSKTEIIQALVSLQETKRSCDESKEFSDKNFALALKDLDANSMENYMIKSLDAEGCSIDARIYYNVQEKILKQLDFYYDILENKYSYFSTNRSDIVLNYSKILYNSLK